MSDYTKSTSFTPKDSLPTGDPNKKIKGSEFDTEFDAIETASGTKANKISGATNNNIVAMDANGDIKDSGETKSSIVSAAQPPGVLSMYVAASAPSGWLLCDGSEVSRSTYSDLYAIIGTTYGSGDGSTTFNVPDMQGRVPLGYGNGSGLTNRSLNDSGGEETVTLASDELPDHEHTLFQDSNANPGAGAGDYVSKRRDQGTDSDWYAATAGATPSPTIGKSGTQEGTTGNSHENMPPYLVVNFIIKT